MKFWFWSSLLALTTAACLKENPGYCPQIIHEDKCVACVNSSDCATAEAPVCGDDFTCRGCQRDTECDSGACGDDGRCVPEEEIVYLDPRVEISIPPCSRTAPCGTIDSGVRETTDIRRHVVMAPGRYHRDVPTTISAGESSASVIYIHGHGAVVDVSSSDGLLNVVMPLVIRDLELSNAAASSIRLGQHGQLVLERVKLRAMNDSAAVFGSGSMKMRDVEFVLFDDAAGIVTTGLLDLDRAIMTGGGVGIRTMEGATVQISNLVVREAQAPGLDLRGARGVVSFSTISGTGLGAAEADGIIASPGYELFIRASIVWTVSSGGPPPILNGILENVIAGPTAVVGAMNLDPRLSASGYHLSGSSPARDRLDEGPAYDFEGDPRPSGMRVDIGADEAR